MAQDLKLPELGEDISSAEVLRVLVSVGETIAKEQPILELETDKATIEVPSTAAGVVEDVRVKVGDQVESGQVMLTLRAERQPPAEDEPAAAGEPAPAGGAPAPAETEPPASQDRPPAPPPAPTPSPPPAPATPAGSRPPESANAAPSVRRLARELGVSIGAVRGSGSGGRISADDVKRYAKELVSRATAAPAAGAAGAPPPLPDFTRWGEVERQPMSGIRRATAVHLSRAWTSIPHVTQHDVADVTQLEAFRQKYGPQVEEAGGVLTMTAMIAKVAASALRAFPQCNSSVDMATRSIIYKRYVNLGIAVDTERGLLVPVIRGADAKSLEDLSIEIAELAARARNQKLAPEDMQGGTFTLTNLGGFGGTAFTPIVNWPEVAILGVSRAAMRPVYVDGEFQPRLMLPLSLSYDHRVVDGADGVRFLRWIVDALEQPMLLSLSG